jgi:hypothetical protein
MDTNGINSGASRTGVVIFLFVLTAGCAASGDQIGAPNQDGNQVMEHESALEPAWTHCARNGQICQFEGTRQVRYGAQGTYSTGTFTDSVLCSGRAFGVRSQRHYTCDYDASEPITDSGTPMADASTPMADASMPMKNMPYVDKSAIPTGDPGVGVPQIEPTSEQPAPSPDGTGDFRTVCKFSHMNFDDPIVFPGKQGASHLHTFFGNTLTDFSSTKDSLFNSGNSTCRGGTANRTAYWVPALLDADGKPQAPDESNFYYKSGYFGIEPGNIHAFPTGLRMVAGDAKSSRSTTCHALARSSTAARAITCRCPWTSRNAGTASISTPAITRATWRTP